MADVYRMDCRMVDGWHIVSVTKNGEPLLADMVYPEAHAAVLAMIADDDRYQEWCDGQQNCDASGAELKASKAKMQARFRE